jgi:uncharacterized phage protein gp47/JayE
MALATYTLDELTDRYRGVIRGLLPSADTSFPSDWYLTARMAAVLHHAAQGMALFVLNQVIASKASPEWVVAWAERIGTTFAEAAAAVGYVQIRGTAGSTQLSGSALTSPDGQAYTTTAGATLALPAWTGKAVGSGSGTARLVVIPSTAGMAAGDVFSVSLQTGTEYRTIREVLASAGAIDLYEALPSIPPDLTPIVAVSGALAPIVATEAGAQGNKLAGETLTLTSPAVGVTAATRLVECTGGGDEETVEELRARVVAYERTRPAAGNAAHIRELARATPNVRIADAFVYPGFRGLGTVDVLVWGVSNARQPGAAVVAKVQAWLDSQCHWGDDIQVRAFVYTTPATVTLNVFCEPGYEPDWTGSFEVGVGANTTTRVYTTTSAIGTIAVGDRVLLPCESPASNWRVYSRSVAAVTAAYIDLDPTDPLPAAMAVGSPITPGGPLGEPVAAAVLDLFDNLGPGVYLAITGQSTATYWERSPSVTETAPGTVHVNALTEAARSVDGVNDATLQELNGGVVDVVPAPGEVVRIGRVKLIMTGAYS